MSCAFYAGYVVSCFCLVWFGECLGRDVAIHHDDFLHACPNKRAPVDPAVAERGALLHEALTDPVCDIAWVERRSLHAAPDDGPVLPGGTAQVGFGHVDIPELAVDEPGAGEVRLLQLRIDEDAPAEDAVRHDGMLQVHAGEIDILQGAVANHQPLTGERK